MTYQISCVLCVLNEIKNIAIIESNIIREKNIEFIIVDGGSTDGTYEILDNMQVENIKLIRLKNQGLLAQRVMGIKKCESEICLLMDADDNLQTINIGNLKKELIDSNYDGLTLQLRYSNPKNFSEFWWDSYFLILNDSYKNTKMLGRPAITYKRFYSDLIVPHGIFCDDLYLAKKIRQNFPKLNYGCASQSVLRISSENSFGLLIKHFFKYGQGDKKACSNIMDYIDLIFHYSIRISIYRSILMIFKRRGIYAPLTFLLGLTRLLGFLTPSKY